MTPELMRFENDGFIPNHPRLPVLVYRGFFATPCDVDEIESVLVENGWTDAWRNGVFPYPHYHTTTHEVLVCYSGSATLRLGGEQGSECEVTAGDVLVLPAGVGHQRRSSSFDFAVLGAYPEGHSPDLKRGESPVDERELRQIGRVPVPARDPVQGADGLPACWA